MIKVEEAGAVRVAVWGIGQVGGAALREVVRLDSLELVGAFGYRADKQGLDVGEVLGMGAWGVQVTGDPAVLIETHPDVVLYSPLDPVDWKQTDEEIWRSEFVGSGLFDQFGFGKSLEEAALGEEMLMAGLERYHSVSIRDVARHMSVVLDSVETSSVKLVATADTCWYIEIEGRPSLRTTVVASASTRDNRIFYGPSACDDGSPYGSLGAGRRGISRMRAPTERNRRRLGNRRNCRPLRYGGLDKSMEEVLA